MLSTYHDQKDVNSEYNYLYRTTFANEFDFYFEKGWELIS